MPVSFVDCPLILNAAIKVKAPNRQYTIPFATKPALATGFILFLDTDGFEVIVDMINQLKLIFKDIPYATAKLLTIC
ncbi:hypothetical protein GCM10007424_04240 [Flavobacterium suaedae]|uniref:Uncharacterized protein n=1 Tax=Flavobacterium suaedae TaxID=1767027 RepID=A0ABQ1JIL1_9FLAO|nr:hypothetical protein GCM10007424_04240 [Flavobacterium suaedae]